MENEEIKQYFCAFNKPAVAVSGGVDSAVLLALACKYSNNVIAYYVKTPLQPCFELDDALDICRRLNVRLNILGLNTLENEKIAANNSQRCYHCKKAMFTEIVRQANADGCDAVFDGTNADDDVEERAGFKALEELSVKSPLRELGLNKKDIRKIAADFGFSIHSKPAYACIATRIQTDIKITEEILNKTEDAELYLMSLGFTDFRVRYRAGDTALIQLKEYDFSLFEKHRKKIFDELNNLYSNVCLDLKER